MTDHEEMAPATQPVDEPVSTPTIPPTVSALPRQEPAPSRSPPPASPGILQGLGRRRLSRRTATLLLVLALLILGSAGGAVCDNAQLSCEDAADSNSQWRGLLRLRGEEVGHGFKPKLRMHN